jgi:hypothetical protein
MKSRSSDASEEMRMPSPNRIKTKQKLVQEEKFSAKPERKQRQQEKENKTDRKLSLACSLLSSPLPSHNLTLSPLPTRAPRVIQLTLS